MSDLPYPFGPSLMYTYNAPEQFSDRNEPPLTWVCCFSGGRDVDADIVAALAGRRRGRGVAGATLTAAAQTTHRGARKRPRGRPYRKNTRRHIAEVIRAHRLAPGLRVDRNMVAALLI